MCPKLNKLIMRYIDKLNKTKMIDFNTIWGAKEELTYTALQLFPNIDRVATRAEIIKLMSTIEKRMQYIELANYTNDRKKKGAVQILGVLLKDLRLMAGLETRPKETELGVTRKLVIHQ